MASNEGFNPAERVLCPDGACIGLIGPDGRCKQCGTVSPTATQHPRHRGMRTDDEVREAEAERDEPSGEAADVEPAPEEFDDRLLCPDGTCIGVIGSDGRCKECGAASAS